MSRSRFLRAISRLASPLLFAMWLLGVSSMRRAVSVGWLPPPSIRLNRFAADGAILCSCRECAACAPSNESGGPSRIASSFVEAFCSLAALTGLASEVGSNFTGGATPAVAIAYLRPAHPKAKGPVNCARPPLRTLGGPLYWFKTPECDGDGGAVLRWEAAGKLGRSGWSAGRWFYVVGKARWLLARRASHVGERPSSRDFRPQSGGVVKLMRLPL